MNPNYCDIIRQMLAAASNFSSNDLLVNAQGKNLVLLSNDLSDKRFSFSLDDPQLKNILKQSERFQKEQGVFPLCVAQGIIRWDFRKAEVLTPIWLSPCKIEKDKVQQLIHLTISEDASFINPFIIHRLKHDFSLETNKIFETLEELKNHLSQCGFTILPEDNYRIGNFHHHRFEVLKELEELLQMDPNDNLLEILGETRSTNHVKFPLTSRNLLATDTDQLAVFKLFQEENCVVQGPPGTGKSQILTNLIAKIIFAQQTCIVLSEKRPALEVIQRKFQTLGLGDLSFVVTAETLAKDAIHELKESWKLLEQLEAEKISNLQLSEQYIDQLQMQLDIINHEALLGGVGFDTFEKLLNNRDLNAVQFISDLPDLKSWIGISEGIRLVYSLKLQDVLSALTANQLSQEQFFRADKEVRELLTQMTKLKDLFEINTWSDLQQAMKKAAICQLYSQPSFQQFENLFDNKSKQQTKFLSLYKKYKQLCISFEMLEKEQTHWIKIPNAQEVAFLLAELEKKSIVSRWNFRRKWVKYSNQPVACAKETLHKQQKYWVIIENISQIKIEFCELGVRHFPVDLDFIYTNIQTNNPQDREMWLAIPLSDRRRLADQNTALNALYNNMRKCFYLEASTPLLELLNNFLNNHFLIVENYQLLTRIPENALRFLRTANSFEEFECSILKSNWVKFISLYPQFKHFQKSQLADRCRQILNEQENEAALFVKELRNAQLQRFQEFHQLLATPAIKLKNKSKEQKERLKKGKAILVKEFAKKRNHMPLRALFASEAKVWIQLLKPVWMSNPAQIAKCFPMERNLFDACLFDEASQMELHNALGSIQRSGRILVAGDGQQMGPSAYFKSKVVDIPDVLHQASFYWRGVQLKHHYRSEHPALIAYSNKYFYQNDLLAFPSYNSTKQPLAFHHIEDGMYDEGKNLAEARQVAAFIEEVIREQNSIGIVAFSEVQLEEIEKLLSPTIKLLLDERIEQGTAFFKALENVQGDECDHLIVSLAYGRNEEGKFAMKFGPLNAQGGAKRLNVLFSRARKKIDLFASVKHTDFKLSTNEAIEKLRFAVLQFELSQEKSVDHTFPLNLAPTINNNKLIFKDIQFKIKEAQELVTLLQVLEKRGWVLDFQ